MEKLKEEVQKRCVEFEVHLAYNENIGTDYLQEFEYILENIEKYESIIDRAIEYLREKDKLNIYDVQKILGIYKVVE